MALPIAATIVTKLANKFIVQWQSAAKETATGECTEAQYRALPTPPPLPLLLDPADGWVWVYAFEADQYATASGNLEPGQVADEGAQIRFATADGGQEFYASKDFKIDPTGSVVPKVV